MLNFDCKVTKKQGDRGKKAAKFAYMKKKCELAGSFGSL